MSASAKVDLFLQIIATQSKTVSEINTALKYRIGQKIRGIKFSPIAHPLYWSKIFAKFNFANRVRSTLQEVVGGGRAYRKRIRTYGVPRSMI